MKYIFILAALLSMNAFAGNFGPARVVSRQLQKKLRLAEKAFSGPGVSILRTHDNEAYYLRRIRLQYAAFAEFEIAVFELKVKPIIEFRWSRKNPKGWTNFKKI
jgi:hypothetical protein